MLEGFLPGTNFFKVDPVSAAIMTTADLNNNNVQYMVSTHVVILDKFNTYI